MWQAKEIPKSPSMIQEQKRRHSLNDTSSILPYPYNPGRHRTEQIILDEIKKTLTAIKSEPRRAGIVSIANYADNLVFGDSLLDYVNQIINFINGFHTSLAKEDFQKLITSAIAALNKTWFQERSGFKELNDELSKIKTFQTEIKMTAQELQNFKEHLTQTTTKLHAFQNTYFIEKNNNKIQQIILYCEEYKKSRQRSSITNLLSNNNSKVDLDNKLETLKHLVSNDMMLLHIDISNLIAIFKEDPKIGYKIIIELSVLQRIYFKLHKERAFVVFTIIQELKGQFASDIENNSSKISKITTLIQTFYCFFFSLIPSKYFSKEETQINLQIIRRINLQNQLGVQLNWNAKTKKYSIETPAKKISTKEQPLELKSSDALSSINWSQKSLNLFVAKIVQLEEIDEILSADDIPLIKQCELFQKALKMEAKKDIGSKERIDQISTPSTTSISTTHSSDHVSSLFETTQQTPVSTILETKTSQFFGNKQEEESILEEIEKILNEKGEVFNENIKQKATKIISETGKLKLVNILLVKIIKTPSPMKIEEISLIQNTIDSFLSLSTSDQENTSWLRLCFPKEFNKIDAILLKIKGLDNLNHALKKSLLEELSLTISALLVNKTDLELPEQHKLACFTAIEQIGLKYQKESKEDISSFLSRIQLNKKYKFNSDFVSETFQKFSKSTKSAVEILAILSSLHSLRLLPEPYNAERQILLKNLIRNAVKNIRNSGQTLSDQELRRYRNSLLQIFTTSLLIAFSPNIETKEAIKKHICTMFYKFFSVVVVIDPLHNRYQLLSTKESINKIYPNMKLVNSLLDPNNTNLLLNTLSKIESMDELLRSSRKHVEKYKVFKMSCMSIALPPQEDNSLSSDSSCVIL